MRSGPSVTLTIAFLFAFNVAVAQTVVPQINPNEPVGVQPYEIYWAHRKEAGPPTLTFADLNGWTMQVVGGAKAVLQLSRAQNLWNRPVGELTYQGDGKQSSNPRITLTPPKPIAIPDGADAVNMWVYGDRWTFGSEPPGTPPLSQTPPVSITLLIRDAAGNTIPVQIASIDWPQWFLLHTKLPAGLTFPADLVGIQIVGGWQAQNRVIYLDSIRFYHELLPPLHFPPLPRRNLTLLPGQSPGANTGPGRLPFPTREQTILPYNRDPHYRNGIVKARSDLYLFTYQGAKSRLTYRFNAKKGLSGLTAIYNGANVGRLMADSSIVIQGKKSNPFTLARVILQSDLLRAWYGDGTELRLQIWQKSLVIDVINRTRRATSIHFGQLTGLSDPRALYIPFLVYGTYGGSSNDPSVLLSRAGRSWVYTSIWPDWYRSNGSELRGAQFAGGATARINGAINYLPLTNGKLNPMYERLFVTVSPSLEEVLPTIANPVGLHAKEAANRLWQESWGPESYVQEEKRSDMLRAYGIRRLIQCNHEIAWRDRGESFTLRTHAAPLRGNSPIVNGEPVLGGGDRALEQYVAHQKSLGWLSGLYTNYSDFAPIDKRWDPNKVILLSDGSWQGAWYRCWAEKPLAAVQFEAEIAPQVEKRYRSDAAYTDVMTAVSPWYHTDFDARLPGAGTFAQTFYAYGQLLRNDSRIYGGPVFSEGTYQCFYAGLDDGNYGHTYNNRPLATEPLLPVFDLLQIHPKECDIGVSWTTFYCDAIPNWQAPQNLDRAIDRFILTTMAYGHIGWLVEEQYGIERTCRSYYMLQQVQARYGLKVPVRIAYWDGQKLVGTSRAVERDLPRKRRQLFLEYPNGLKLWLNDSPDQDWLVKAHGMDINVPPAGWVVEQEKSRRGPLFSFSALRNGRKYDFLRSAAYTYQDGRGHWFETESAGSNGALAIIPGDANYLKIVHISGTGAFEIKRPYGMKGVVVQCKSYAVNGQQLHNAVLHDSGNATWIEPVNQAIRYVLIFSGKTTWSIQPQRAVAAPGSRVPILLLRVGSARLVANQGTVSHNVLTIPADAKIGTWVRVTAIHRKAIREAMIQVIAPVQWRFQSVVSPEKTTLAMKPIWFLGGLPRARLAVHGSVSDGFEVSPRKLYFSSTKPPSEINLVIRPGSTPAVSGRLTVTVSGCHRNYSAQFQLTRRNQPAKLFDLTSLRYQWGIALRGQHEEPDDGTSGAMFSPGQELPVGGAVKHGIFMHPPYIHGIGYTWAISEPIRLPNEPVEFHSFIGLKDGGDPSVGLDFILDVINSKGQRIQLASKLGVQHQWRVMQADLSRFEGQQVRLVLRGNVVHNNSTADWGSWGEPEIRLMNPASVIEVSPIVNRSSD